MEKKILTREEFEAMRLEKAQQMQTDKDLLKKAQEVQFKASQKYYWTHQSTWFGEPTIQFGQDIMALQEIIFKSRPDYILEIGVCWGGSLLFYSTLMEVLGGKKIIGIDIFIPDDLKERLLSHGKLSERIELLTGSSTDQKTLEKVKEIIGDSKKVMIVLDSNHIHEHVLEELKLYEPLMKEGQYLVCADTILEYEPENKDRPRPWGPGNSPKSALDEFLKTTDRFENDRELENKLLFTCTPTGYLRCIKN
ncbi:MAG: class I SAM-dependent methyltransferase [Halobacteriovoraceae bacterium]|nr:class I SAM-dependent methyltransferase [Halobacteriovoraceae bacterium]